MKVTVYDRWGLPMPPEWGMAHLLREARWKDTLDFYAPGTSARRKEFLSTRIETAANLLELLEGEGSNHAG